MSDSGSAELSVLLSQLNARTVHTQASKPSPPSPSEAMAMYFVAARLVELQLHLADTGVPDEGEIAMTRDVLFGTHRILTSALAHVEAHDALHERPSFRVVDGGEAGGKPRRRRSRRYYA